MPTTVPACLSQTRLGLGPAGGGGAQKKPVRGLGEKQQHLCWPGSAVGTKTRDGLDKVLSARGLYPKANKLQGVERQHLAGGGQDQHPQTSGWIVKVMGSTGVGCYNQ